MPSSQIVSTPIIIQQAWNDGLFNLREKRNGLARGSTIEEKCMYVLGLGWKFRGTSEVRDEEITNTLYISLEGLTQESKFLKIGQVLWEQCDQEFILKMISSLSNNTPSQSRVYQQISIKEKQNFKGYFSKVSMKNINTHVINAHGILNRESRQMSTNTTTTQRNRDDVLSERTRLQGNNINSKGFEKRLIRFQASNSEIKLLAEQLTVILRTVESNNIPSIAMDLGIDVESGFNKKYLTEEIIGAVCSFVEKELLFSRSSSSKGNSNVYLRQGQKGLDVIKRLLRYTHFGLMFSDDNMSVDDLNQLTSDIQKMRKSMGLGSKGGKFNVNKFDRAIKKRDDFLDRVTTTEQSNIEKGKKIKSSQSQLIYNLITEKLGNSTDGNLSFYRGSRRKSDTKKDKDAVDFWISKYEYDTVMGLHVIGNDVTDNDLKSEKLQFDKYTTSQLLEKLVMISSAMGIDKSILSTLSAESGLSLAPNNPGLYLVAIIRRHIALQKEGNRFGILGFGRKNRRRELDAIASKIEDNIRDSEKSKAENDKMFSKGADGIYSPLSVDPKTLKDFYTRMQPVYVVGGSVYSFSQGGFTVSEGVSSSSIGEKVIKQIAVNKILSGPDGPQLAYEMSKNGENLMAHGTQMSPLIQGKNESNNSYIRRVIEAKMINEFKDKGLEIRESIQPVFLVNKGINTSNVEATALLNLLPSVLELIPGVGTAAGMALRGLLQSEIDAAKNLPKFARGGSFTTRNNNISQFISGDSINNRINPERVTIDWASQRVNVQPLNNTVNNVTNVENGRITDPIMGIPTTIKVSDKSGKSTEALSVYNSINPFDENLSVGGINASPMEVLVSLKESLVEILGTLAVSSQTEQTHASMTAKVVDAINNLNKTMGNQQGSDDGRNIFGSLTKLARGE
jgi:hypothetical protein